MQPATVTAEPFGGAGPKALPIEGYAIIGDRRAAALVSRAGSILSWLLHSTSLTQPELRVLDDVHGRPPPPERALGSFPQAFTHVVHLAIGWAFSLLHVHVAAFEAWRAAGWLREAERAGSAGTRVSRSVDRSIGGRGPTPPGPAARPERGARARPASGRARRAGAADYSLGQLQYVTWEMPWLYGAFSVSPWVTSRYRL